MWSICGIKCLSTVSVSLCVAFIFSDLYYFNIPYVRLLPLHLIVSAWWTPIAFEGIEAPFSDPVYA